MIDPVKLTELLKACRDYGVDYIESEGITIKLSPLGMPNPMAQSEKVLPDIQSYANLRQYDSLHGIPSFDEGYES